MKGTISCLKTRKYDFKSSAVAHMPVLPNHLPHSGGSRMEAKGGLNSGYVGLKLEINKNLRLINPNLMNKSYL